MALPAMAAFAAAASRLLAPSVTITHAFDAFVISSRATLLDGSIGLVATAMGPHPPPQHREMLGGTWAGSRDAPAERLKPAYEYGYGMETGRRPSPQCAVKDYLPPVGIFPHHSRGRMARSLSKPGSGLHMAKPWEQPLMRLIRAIHAKRSAGPALTRGRTWGNTARNRDSVRRRPT